MTSCIVYGSFVLKFANSPSSKHYSKNRNSLVHFWTLAGDILALLIKLKVEFDTSWGNRQHTLCNVSKILKKNITGSRKHSYLYFLIY